MISSLFAVSNAATANPKVLTGLVADGEPLSIYSEPNKQFVLVTFNSSNPADNFVKDKFDLIYHGGAIDGAYLNKEGKTNIYGILFHHDQKPDPSFKFVGKKLTYKEGFSFIKCRRHIHSFKGETLMMVKGKLDDKTCMQIKSITKTK